MTSQFQPASSRNNSFWSRSAANYLLWTLQWLLALLFVFSGVMKLILPVEEMTKQMPLPGLFLRFIAVMELLGAAGLVLPWMLRIRRYLTPLAACGLVMVMVGATAVSLIYVNFATAIMPFIVGVLLLLVAYGRSFQFKQQQNPLQPVDFAPSHSTNQ